MSEEELQFGEEQQAREQQQDGDRGDKEDPWAEFGNTMKSVHMDDSLEDGDDLDQYVV